MNKAKKSVFIEKLDGTPHRQLWVECSCIWLYCTPFIVDEKFA
jgi:hypothetical protein